ncbi:MAG: hypothetical protein OXE86_11525 [Alphaproteobacteria bacterium]|nr:hypothetical protein [Alphaproteobacteria bacterium]
MGSAPTRHLLRAVAIGLLVGGLSACRFDPELGFVTVAEPAVEQQAALNAGPDELAPVPPVAASSPVATVALGPRWPLQRTGEEIRQVLGSPQFVRDDALAQLWRYRTEDCILNLFLFPVAEQVRATHAMYLWPSLEPLPNRGARNRCLSDLVRQATAGAGIPPDQSTAGDLSVN